MIDPDTLELVELGKKQPAEFHYVQGDELPPVNYPAFHPSDPRAVVVTCKSQLKKLNKQYGMIEVGNDREKRPPLARDRIDVKDIYERTEAALKNGYRPDPKFTAQLRRYFGE
jgi:hypothetical protein